MRQTLLVLFLWLIVPAPLFAQTPTTAHKIGRAHV